VSVLDNSWTARTALVRAAEVLRREGLRSLWFKVLGETVYRRLRLYELPLTEESPPLATPPELEFRFLDESDLEAYAAFRPDRDLEEARARLRRGDRCFAALEGGSIVAARWLATGEAEIEYLACTVRVREGSVYRYDSFTDPRYRGRGVIGVTGARLAPELWASGVRRIVGAAMPENRAGVRVFEKEGFRPFAKLGYVRIGRRRWDFGPQTL
jgi:GNAT superfamily N-acetyltransferase